MSDSTQKPNSITGKIRTRHWAFGISVPAQMAGMSLIHTTSISTEMMMVISVLGTIFAGFHDLFKNSGKN